MNNKIIANKVNVLADEILAKMDYVYDPDHKNKPRDGGNWHKTEKGWSKKETKESTATPEQKKLVEKSNSKDPDDRASVASDPNLPMKRLLELSKDVNYEVQAKAAENPKLPSDTLDDLSKSDFWRVRQGVAKNPNTSYDTLRKLALNDDDNDVKRSAEATLRNIKDKVLEDAMASSDYTQEQKQLIQMARSFKPIDDFITSNGEVNQRAQAAKSKNLPIPFLMKLGDDENIGVKQIALKNPNMPEDVLKKAALESKGNDFDQFAEEACSNPNLKDQDFLREAPSFGVNAKLGVLKNPNTPLDVLEKYAKSEKFPFDRKYVAEHPNVSQKLLEDLSNDSDWIVREAVATNKNASHEVLHKLASDGHFGVRGMVAENENTDPDDLIKLANDDVTSVVRHCASNPKLPSDVLADLASNADYDTRKAALHNPNLPVETVIAYAQKTNGWQQNVANHPKLPAEYIEKFVNSKDAGDRLTVLANPNISDEQVMKLTRDGDQLIKEKATKLLMKRKKQ